MEEKLEDRENLWYNNNTNHHPDNGYAEPYPNMRTSG